MDEHITQLISSAERLAQAAEALDHALARLDARHEALNSKVDRIVAAIDEDAGAQPLKQRIADLEQQNAELKAQAGRLSRKTLSPLASALLAKSFGEGQEKIDAAALDKALALLSLEQRIAVKAEMARAGIID